MSYGNRFFRAIVSFLEWFLKKVTGPRWRPAGAIRVLPPSALIYDRIEETRADDVFRTLSQLGFTPTRVPVDGSAAETSRTTGAIARGSRDCWATVLLEPLDAGRAANVGPAFREYAHTHPDVVAIVLGPLPSRSEILDRYRHVVTDDGGGVAAPDLAAGIAHASAARVLHTGRLLNTAVVALTVVVAAAAVAPALIRWVGGR